MTNLHLATDEERVWERVNLWSRLRPNMGSGFPTLYPDRTEVVDEGHAGDGRR
jgi:hypothetical protein